MAKRTGKSKTDFLALLKKATTEEEVKHAYAAYFNIPYNTSGRHDLYTDTILFEFKYDKNFKSIKACSQVLAQTLYYIRRLKFGAEPDKAIPSFICIADVDEAILTQTILWNKFYDDVRGKYDWDLAPSLPDDQLVKDIADSTQAHELHAFDISESADLEEFHDKLSECLDPQMVLSFVDKKVITESNFEDVYRYWEKIFGAAVQNGFKSSRYFVSDILEGNTLFQPESGRVVYRINDKGDFREKKIPAQDYHHFWSLYQKVTNGDIVRAVLAKIDRLTDDNLRRFHGEFFTPLRFAQKALEYVERTVGANWWETDEYRLWDMAAGTGNLEYHLPQKALKCCYLSTLDSEDTEHLARLFSDATVFQYDYLNDDVGNLFARSEDTLDIGLTWKLPAKLRADLNNPKIKWIILINPPFATSQTAGTNSRSKEGVSDTAIRTRMHADNLGEVSRELFSQFLYRIKHEFQGKQTHLALFSTIKYINATNDQKFRDTVFDFKCERGFVFSSLNFEGTKQGFPVGVLVWLVNAGIRLSEQTIDVDVYNEDVEKIGTKRISSEHRDTFLSKWIDRPKCDQVFPPFGSAIAVKADNADQRDRVADGFLASLMCNGNDFQHQNNTAFLSGPYVSAGALSVTPKNFEQAMVVHAARLVPMKTWLNNRDQFKAPTTALDARFVTDCAVWNLFSNGNHTASLRNVVYKGQTYQIPNNFFPFPIAELRQWEITDRDFVLALASAEDRFAAHWLGGRTLSAEAAAVLAAGRAVYQFYFQHLGELRLTLYRIETWDAGWWQIKQALKNANLGGDLMESLKQAHTALGAGILPRLSEYRIID